MREIRSSGLVGGAESSISVPTPISVQYRIHISTLPEFLSSRFDSLWSSSFLIPEFLKKSPFPRNRHGAGDEIRTRDLTITNRLLYH